MKMSSGLFGLSKTIAITSLAVAALALQAQEGDSSSKSKLSTADKTQVLQKAAEMNLAIQKCADLAQQKGQAPEVKQYAQGLKQDKERMHQELERVAQKHNVTLPTTVDPECQEKLSKLQALSGQEFDREFAKGAIEGHAAAVAAYEHASAGAQDTDIRQLTQQLLAKAKENQRKGREMAKAVGIDQTTISSLESKGQEAVGAAASSATGTSSSKKSSDDPSSGNKQSEQPEK